ncbi:flagellar motor protein MotB [Bacillus sp. B1-b2]|uniref:flagellar motor protein MotB n=1 Tax=Bacillus sp. B1-b2 TaxID=2653201 RepID=UPI0012627D2F|nr:flagellar motor protein MotB [Bacillus sp. B1-b2]KAB7672520.1 flagellar motor protein MotB [Bacillus sp. B1-b2]
MSKKRKKKEHHEEHVDESWLVPYADVLTLLLALFIVLYGMSSLDAKKFSAMAEVFNQEFQSGTGVLDFPSPAPSKEEKNLDTNEEVENNQDDSKSVSDEKLKELQKEQDQQELAEVQQKVNAYIEQNNLGGKLETELTDEGLHVSIRDNVLFASGSAEVRDADKNIVSEISKLLVMDPPRSIIVSGHTDNVPIHNSQYSSNWELSVTRALNFMKLLLENNELDPRAFSAKGFGEYQPIASNDTAEGREKNRRVDILIQPREEVTN